MPDVLEWLTYKQTSKFEVEIFRTKTDSHSQYRRSADITDNNGLGDTAHGDPMPRVKLRVTWQASIAARDYHMRPVVALVTRAHSQFSWRLAIMPYDTSRLVVVHKVLLCFNVHFHVMKIENSIIFHASACCVSSFDFENQQFNLRSEVPLAKWADVVALPSGIKTGCFVRGVAQCTFCNF